MDESQTTRQTNLTTYHFIFTFKDMKMVSFLVCQLHEVIGSNSAINYYPLKEKLAVYFRRH